MDKALWGLPALEYRRRKGLEMLSPALSHKPTIETVWVSVILLLPRSQQKPGR